MNKAVKYTLIGLAVVGILAAAYYGYRKYSAKKETAETEAPKPEGE